MRRSLAALSSPDRDVVMSRVLTAALALLLTASSTSAAAPPRLALDRQGDSIPAGARVRLGTARLRHAFHVRIAALSPDGRLLATTDYSHLHIWDRATGKELHRFPLEHASLLAFGPRGKTLSGVEYRTV